MHAFILAHVDVRCEWLPNHSNYKYLNIQFQFISLSLFLPFINHLHRFILLSCFLYLTSLFHMLTAWLGICWPPGSLNQSRASLTERAHTCPDRNDNDCGQSPPIFTVATVISLFWNAHSGVWGEVLHSDGCENAEPVSKEETLLSVQFHVNFTSPPDKSKHCFNHSWDGISLFVFSNLDFANCLTSIPLDKKR